MKFILFYSTFGGNSPKEFERHCELCENLSGCAEQDRVEQNDSCIASHSQVMLILRSDALR